MHCLAYLHLLNYVSKRKPKSLYSYKHAWVRTIQILIIKICSLFFKKDITLFLEIFKLILLLLHHPQRLFKSF